MKWRELMHKNRHFSLRWIVQMTPNMFFLFIITFDIDECLHILHWLRFSVWDQEKNKKLFSHQIYHAHFTWYVSTSFVLISRVTLYQTKQKNTCIQVISCKLVLHAFSSGINCSILTDLFAIVHLEHVILRSLDIYTHTYTHIHKHICGHIRIYK